MNALLDNSLVGLALIISAGYAVASLGPRSLRRRVLAVLARGAARAPQALRLGRVAQWLAVAADGKPPGACGGCNDCGSESTPAQKPPPAEVNVPVSKIGRRT
jgi:hypothetical protein